MQQLAFAFCVFSDLDNMKGSTVDAMSAAVDGAEVMLFCVSQAYKESASKLHAAAVAVIVSTAHSLCYRGSQTVVWRLSIVTSKT